MDDDDDEDDDTVCWQREITYLESESNTNVYLSHNIVLVLHVLCLPILVYIIMIIQLEHSYMNPFS